MLGEIYHIQKEIPVPSENHLKRFFTFIHLSCKSHAKGKSNTIWQFYQFIFCVYIPHSFTELKIPYGAGLSVGSRETKRNPKIFKKLHIASKNSPVKRFFFFNHLYNLFF